MIIKFLKIVFSYLFIVLLLSGYNNNVVRSAEGEEDLTNLITAEFHNENTFPVRIYYSDAKTEMEEIAGQVQAKDKASLKTHPNHSFVAYDYSGIRLEKFTVTSDYGSEHSIKFVIRDFSKVEAVFLNRMPEDVGTMAIYWMNFETQEEVFNGSVDVNRRISVNTDTKHKFVAYNADMSIRLGEFEVTAKPGQSQMFILENRVSLSFNNPSKAKNGPVHVYWQEKVDEGAGKEGLRHHSVGTIHEGDTITIKTDSFHEFVAFTLNEETNEPEKLIDQYVVTAGVGESQTFVIGKDEL